MSNLPDTYTSAESSIYSCLRECEHALRAAYAKTTTYRDALRYLRDKAPRELPGESREEFDRRCEVAHWLAVDQPHIIAEALGEDDPRDPPQTLEENL